ncbi:MAG: hypothetical protein R2748_15245 [Bryobacterales bacterium]
MKPVPNKVPIPPEEISAPNEAASVAPVNWTGPSEVEAVSVTPEKAS